jgi:hypothetical protein
MTFACRKEPFNAMVDREGKNVSSQQNLNLFRDGEPRKSAPTYIPGPGQYEVSSGFDQI